MKLINYEATRRKLDATKPPSRRTVERMVKCGEFVQPVQITPRRVMFDEAEVDAWLEARKRKGGER